MKSISTALALIASVEAGLRFPCSTLTFQRLDPVVEPGNTPSAHVHHIVGGNAFNASMSGDVGNQASCTTCQMSEDFSNYWTAVLYFKHPTNGSYHRVPVLPVQPLLGGSNGAQGGITVYYTQFDLSRDNIKQQPIKSFQPGFRMTVGSPTATSKQHVGLTYQCLTGNSRGRETADFPDKPCTGGIFTTHHFPACWDGKNLDSPDHQSHMFFTKRTDGFTNAPACPSSHPVRVPQVTYETTWDTSKFNSMWTSGAPNPFVWSFEGGKGFGTHADYMFGWKGDSLQRAMDKSECFYDGCGSITKQAMATANKCTVPDRINEETVGWLSVLPGQSK
ncbi:hypothetical protein BU24DRAFT_450004 [Aaosphaeria arxii CBS 175.79]|uniref:DUF1996 domain-containing protein n=1 Tax=Aaosphaeria arxii CBS 175.79 TaxID=1450172 RepID=A0A6A5XR66_9PLEO|nr:uncharacterized protein BU24DRAFT_450004 [Aaosphaeria arxii CBS 175.79]KAF2015251.1 hypothetical protein BU24DRAFT_450004 [Aaosphaeria arxii CBS 175.79]